MDEAGEVEGLLCDIEELDQLIFEARARHMAREYLEAGWITQEQADNIISLFGEPCL